MTAIEDTKRQARQLRDQARSARSQAQDIVARTRMTAKATAATEDLIAATIGRLAEQQPHRAERLRAMSESARSHAAREWQRLARQPGTCRCGRGHPPAASQPAPGPASAPEAAASATPPDQGGDLSVIGERDRIAAQLQDTIIRRVFAAGLSLESAAGLTRNPEARRRIEAAVDELDQVICEIRTAVFQDLPHPHGHRLSKDILDLSEQLATTASVRFSSLADRAMPADDNARLLMLLRQLLGLIGEHATPTGIEITADTVWYRLTIEAASLSPCASAGESASWLSSVQASAAQTGVGVAIEPVPGGTRFTCQLPASLASNGSSPGAVRGMPGCAAVRAPDD
jgi:signal transduction histidine kinase